MSLLTPTHFENPAEKYEIIIFTNLLSISSRITPLYLKLNVLLDHSYDIYLYHVLNVESQEMIVLNKIIKKLDLRKIVKARTISGIIKKKDKIYIIDSDTSEYQYLSFFSKNKLYAGTNNENESVNYAYNEPFYIFIFNHRNTAFNTKMNKFNTYRLNLTKTLTLDTYIYKSDLSRITYSGIKANLNKII